MFKLAFIAIFASLMALTSSQQCDQKVVKWLPHPFICSKYILCFHGNEIEKSCAPNLHFNAETFKCDFPTKARCRENFYCPLRDDVKSAVFYPDRNDCQRFFICFKGNPIQRSCADGLWWDVNDERCTIKDKVTCDERTTNNPNPPTTTTNNPNPPTTYPLPPREPPNLSACHIMRHLFNQKNGKYLKSFCISSSVLNYEQSQNYCRSNKMESFVIDNSAVQAAFFMSVTEALSDAHPRGYVWINGRRERTTGKWFTLSPDRQPLYSGIDWVQTKTITGHNNGDCLVYSANYNFGHYQPLGLDCNSKFWLTCQFYVPFLMNQ